MKNTRIGGLEFMNYNKKLDELTKKEKALNHEFLSQGELQIDPYLKKAIEKLQDEKKALEERVERAEDRQTPEYIKFKKKLEYLESENNSMKEIINRMKEREKEKTVPHIRRSLKKLEEEKSELLDNLKHISSMQSPEYYQTNKKIDDIKKKEKELNKVLLKEGLDYKEDLEMKRAVEQLSEENQKLNEHLKRAEDKQTPEYHKFKDLIENLENENKNLRDSMEKLQEKNKFKIIVHEIQSDKAELLDDLKKVEQNSIQYQEISKKIEELSQKEKEYNEEIIKRDEGISSNSPHWINILKNLQSQNKSLTERLKIEENLQSPEANRLMKTLNELKGEREILGEALGIENVEDIPPIKETIEKLKKERKVLKNALQQTPEDVPEYKNIKEQLIQTERELNEKEDGEMKSLIKKLHNENKVLVDLLEIIEENKDPLMRKAKQRASRLKQENSNLFKAMQMKEVNPKLAQVKVALNEIQNQKEELREDIKRAEVLNKPEGPALKRKMENLNKIEQDIKKEIGVGIREDRGLEMIQNEISKIKENKKIALDELKDAEINQTKEVPLLKEELKNLEDQEKVLLKDLVKARTYDNQSKQIRKLENENKNLIEDLKIAEENKDPDYKLLKAKMERLEKENMRLMETGQDEQILDLNAMIADQEEERGELFYQIQELKANLAIYQGEEDPSKN